MPAPPSVCATERLRHRASAVAHALRSLGRSQFMELYKTLDDNDIDLYVLHDRGQRVHDRNEIGADQVLIIVDVDEDEFVKQDITNYQIYRDGGTTIYNTESGYVATFPSRFKKSKKATLRDPSGTVHVLKEAYEHDSMWETLINKFKLDWGRKRPKYTSRAWEEEEDALVRGWNKKIELLCVHLPTRTYAEIKERKEFLGD